MNPQRSLHPAWAPTEAGNYRRRGVLVRESAEGWEWLWPDEDHQPDATSYPTPQDAMRAADRALDENDHWHSPRASVTESAP